MPFGLKPYYFEYIAQWNNIKTSYYFQRKNEGTLLSVKNTNQFKHSYEFQPREATQGYRWAHTFQIMLICKRFTYQCLDNVKIYKYAKFDKYIPCSPRGMNMFAKRPQPAQRSLVTILYTSGWTMNINKNKLQFITNN